jgi:hypothetical protein
LVAGRLTRGVVAAHQDDDGGTGAPARPDSLTAREVPTLSGTSTYRGSTELPGESVEVGYAADPRIEVQP